MTTDSSLGLSRRERGLRTTIARMALPVSDMSSDISTRVNDRNSRSMYSVP